MYNIKNLSKRGLALLLTLVMCLGMLNLTVFAEDASVTYHPVEIASQNTEGVTVGGPDGTSINGKKTIAPVSGTENQFDITLEVTTTSKSTTTTVTKAADVVLVLDVTKSMDNGDRWKDMKNAVNNFVDKLLPAGNTTNRVSIVIYAGDYYRLCDWNTGAAAVKATYQRAANSGDLRKFVTDDDDSHRAGTNCSAGFLGADVQLGTARSDALQYVVFMTDGNANTYYKSAKSDKATCGNNWHWHNSNCYTVSAVSNNSGGVTWEGNYKVNYSSTAAIAQTTRLKDNHPDATLIAVGFGTSSDNKVVSKSSNKSLDLSYTTGNLDFNAILADISQSITNDVNASGTVVTDPMSQYVTFQEVTSGLGYSFNGESKVLSWDLSKAKPTTTEGDYTISTYTLTYRVTVNRDAKFYEAVKASTNETDGTVAGVPTNNRTSMPYKLGDESGELEFIVPKVKSEMPEATWRIEYYKQGSATLGDYANYTKVEKDTKGGRGDFGTQVNLEDEDSSYVNKYNGFNNGTIYELEAVDQELLTIGLDPDANVIKVYYKKVGTTAQVNYHYTLTTIDENGNVSDPVTTDIYYGTPVTGLYVGESYSVTPDQTSEHGGVTYNFEKAEPGATIDRLNSDASKNVIDLYYKATLDKRAEASVVVDHVYRTHTYVLNQETGRYKEQVTETKVPGVEQATAKATMTYTAVNRPQPDHESYTPAPENEAAKTITLKPGNDNKITLYFDYTVDGRGDPIQVTVVHHYTEQVIGADDNGDVKTTTHEYTDTKDTVTRYKDEKFVAEEQTTYDGKEYTPDPTNAGNLVIDPLTEPTTINLYYSRVEKVDPTTVTVNHIYQTRTVTTEVVYEEVEVEKTTVKTETDAEGNTVEVPVTEIVTEKVPTGTIDIPVTTTDHTEEVVDNNVYVGQKYTAPIVAWGEGYDCKTDEAARTAIVVADGKTFIEVYYLRDNGNIDNQIGRAHV